jgi:hypothetical protein
VEGFNHLFTNVNNGSFFSFSTEFCMAEYTI